MTPISQTIGACARPHRVVAFFDKAGDYTERYHTLLYGGKQEGGIAELPDDLLCRELLCSCRYFRDDQSPKRFGAVGPPKSVSTFRHAVNRGGAGGLGMGVWSVLSMRFRFLPWVQSRSLAYASTLLLDLALAIVANRTDTNPRRSHPRSRPAGPKSIVE